MGRRAVVRVLLRGLTLYGSDDREAPSHRVMGDFRVVLIGEAKAEHWPGRRLRAGDIEGIVWTTTTELPNVINRVRQVAGVLDARGEASDPTLPPPPDV